jgi:hypothetical protein
MRLNRDYLQAESIIWCHEGIIAGLAMIVLSWIVIWTVLVSNEASY